MRQVRGSIPMFWSHTNVMAPKPDIFIHEVDPTFGATKRHFDRWMMMMMMMMMMVVVVVVVKMMSMMMMTATMIMIIILMMWIAVGRLFARYGGHVTVLNLVRQMEKKPKESYLASVRSHDCLSITIN
jgi:hypothetical protein